MTELSFDLAYRRRKLSKVLAADASVAFCSLIMPLQLARGHKAIHTGLTGTCFGKSVDSMFVFAPTSGFQTGKTNDMSVRKKNICVCKAILTNLEPLKPLTNPPGPRGIGLQGQVQYLSHSL